MRLLFLTTFLPFPVNNGVAMRSAAILTTLAESSHVIDLIAFGREQDAGNSEARRLCSTIRTVAHVVRSQTAKIDYWGRLKLLGSSLPYGTHLCRSSAMQEVIEDLLSKGAVDALICDTLDSMVNLPRRYKVPVILNSHNVEHLIFRRYAARETNPARRAYAWLEAGKLFRWEQRACERADMVLVCSNYDREVLQRMCPAARFEVVPNVVDTRTYFPNDEHAGNTLLYTGGMDWHPNRDAVEFFAFSVLPKIRRNIPDVKFVVAGRNPSAEFVRQFAGVPWIEFTGTVPDMRAQIARATVCVVPLRIGSGTRLKILEAGAMAKAIVSTGLGAEGLDFVDGQEIVLADEPEAFADVVVALLGDAERRKQIGAAARRKVEQNYSFEVLRKSLARAMLDLQTSLDDRITQADAEAGVRSHPAIRLKP